jgi:EmrB/QacA subfamily drug resistance transporter
LRLLPGKGSTAGMVDPDDAKQTVLHRMSGHLPTWRPPRGFIAPVFVIGGMTLATVMTNTAAIFALPRIQNALNLSDAGRSWVITAYMLAFGGLLLLGGRLGDTLGRKRTFMIGIALFTIASVVCGVAWNEGVLVLARLLNGAAAAIITPNSLALIATTFGRGPVRNAAMAVYYAMADVGMVVGMLAGAAIADISWRLTFLMNVPIGLLVLYLARTTLRETEKERSKLDAAGAGLATLVCAGAVFGLSTGPERGWLSATTIGSGLVVLAASMAFVAVERTAENPVLPFSLFRNRDRLATFTAMFLSGGMTITLTVLVALYVQNVLGYSAWHAGISFIPFAMSAIIGVGAASRLVMWFPPRVVVIAGCVLLLAGMLYGSTLNRGIQYFPHLVVPIIVAGISFPLISVPLTLSLIASVDSDRIGPALAIAMMLQNLGGPIVLVAIQAVVTSHTLYLGGTSGPGKFMNRAQLDALDHGYTYGLLWLAGVAVLLGGVALLIGYSAQQVAQAKKATKAIETGEP